MQNPMLQTRSRNQAQLRRVTGQRVAYQKYHDIRPYPDCRLRTISAKRESVTDLSVNPETLAKDTDVLTMTSTVLNHFGWFVGLQSIRKCDFESPYFNISYETLPSTAQDCTQMRSLQAKMVAPTQLPIRKIASQFFSGSEHRLEYAVLATPGGDIGEFIRALAVLEEYLLRPLARGEVYRLLYGLFQHLLAESYGQRFFYMGTDALHHDAWYKSVGLKPDHILNPLDDGARKRLIRSANVSAHIGDDCLRGMVAHNGTWGVRPELAVEGIRIFLSVYFNGFDPLRQHMLYVKATHSKVSAGPQGAAVVAGRGCKHTAPLVVPHLRATPPTNGTAGKGVNASGFIVYHRTAATVLREQIVTFLTSAHPGLNRARTMLRLTALGDHAYKMLVNHSGISFNTFSVIFDET